MNCSISLDKCRKVSSRVCSANLDSELVKDRKLVHYRGDYTAFKKMHLQKRATLDKEYKKQQESAALLASCSIPGCRLSSHEGDSMAGKYFSLAFHQAQF